MEISDLDEINLSLNLNFKLSIRALEMPLYKIGCFSGE